MSNQHGARAFLSGLIDYAGLFPPAALPLGPALAEYARLRAGPGAWMLGRFIISAPRLDALAGALATDPSLRGGQSWGLTVLAGAPDLAAALTGLSAQADAIVACEQSGPGGLAVEALELVLPAKSGAALALAEALADEGLSGRDLFLEVGGDVEAALDGIAAAAAVWSGPSGAFPKLGVKLRCGGSVADAFPSTARIAAVIGGATRRGLPLKFTAGLHHPVRHLAAEPAVMMHGFLNVVGAAVLAASGNNDAAVLLGCLEETDAAAFRLDQGGFAWLDHAVAAADVRAARASVVGGFGSCSFDEPRQDLAALGLLPE